MLTQAKLKESLSYDPSTGNFIWLRNAPGGGSTRVGDRAGTIEQQKYLRIGLDGTSYYAHRLAWLYMTGTWPSHGIDHINGDRRDNRWTNLRQADHSLNNQNLKIAKRHNATGLLGVGKNGSGFMASIRIDNKRHYLGTFRTAMEAHQAYLKAKRKLHPGGTL